MWPLIGLYLLQQHRRPPAPARPPGKRVATMAPSRGAQLPKGAKLHGQAVVTPPAAMNPQTLLHLWLLFKGLG